MELSNRTEKKILDAATVVFLQKGKDGARMDEIAQQAGVFLFVLLMIFVFYNDISRIFSR